jgi:hypothetical protein
LKEQCQTFAVYLPSEHTPYIQQVDDNCGKLFRDEIYKCYDKWVENFSTSVKLTASTVRQKLIEWTASAAIHWNTVLATRIGTFESHIF